MRLVPLQCGRKNAEVIPIITRFCQIGYGLWPVRVPWPRLLALASAALLGVTFGRTFIGPVSIVDGPSMAPTFLPGACLHTAALTEPLERGDIVLIEDGSRETALKRIVGLPGETIHLWRGRVFINDKMIFEPYLPKHTYTYPTQQQQLGAAFRLRHDQYFVLGDNRLCSIDSRAYGPIAESRIKRRVPLAQEFLRPQFAQYTLPAAGALLIRPL